VYSSRHKPKVLEIYPCSYYQRMKKTEKTSEMLGWDTVQTWQRLLQIFWLNLITKKTPSDKTALKKTWGLNSGNASYDADNSIWFHFSYPSALYFKAKIHRRSYAWSQNLSLYGNNRHNVFEKSILRRIF
jgi:hypothetical protein